MDNFEGMKEVITHSMRDDALCHLVECANIGAGVDITVITGGQMITGTLVSGDEYSRTTASAIRSMQADDVLKNAIAKFFDDLALDYRKEEGHQIPLNYLHLKNPAYYTSGKWQLFEGSIVRIHIEKVNGFTLGRFSNK